jgi:hypothetical protein
MSFDTQTKLAIYRYFAETGQRPSLHVVAERVGANVSTVREAYVRLRAQRSLSTLNPQLSTPVQTLCAALLQKECDDRENRVEHERRDREGAIGRGRTA